MKLEILLLIIVPILSNGQVTITGKVIDEFDLTPIPEVKIQDADTVALGMTDKNGNFEIQLPSGKLNCLSFIGMERTSIKVPSDCGKLEIIMMVDVIYDYVSGRRLNKKRYRLFTELPDKDHQAFEKGIFTSNAPCFTYIFLSIKTITRWTGLIFSYAQMSSY
jgi:hypothetical protein